MNKTVCPSRLKGTLRIMPSKSASHRAVMMAALCTGQTELAPLQLSQDIEATLRCAQSLGLVRADGMACTPEADDFVRVKIRGAGQGEPSPLRTADCGESGSTLRFFIPLALDGLGAVRFVGHGRLMQRPLSVYKDLLTPLGVRWQEDGDALTVCGRLQSGVYRLPGDVSSQFVTGLLLALPRLEGDSRIELTTPLESRAYVDLTRQVQSAFGVISHWTQDARALVIPGGQTYASPGRLRVEGDWSHAAFYLVAGALGAGPVTLRDLNLGSVQGDRAIVRILQGMGADVRVQGGALVSRPASLHAACVDVSQCPDLAPILAVAMAAAQGESRITGAARLRIKESDRLASMRAALCAAGATVRETADGLIVRGGLPLHAAAIDGANDHRIVMAMAVASALSDGPLCISCAEAVAKSAPAFWQEWKSLGGDAT